jgi:hypothetical protein
MSILRAVVGGIAGLLTGYFGAAFLSGIVMGWYGVSDFEGGRGMAAAFLFGPLGGLLGLVGGIWAGLRLGRQAAGWKGAEGRWHRPAGDRRDRGRRPCDPVLLRAASAGI